MRIVSFLACFMMLSSCIGEEGDAIVDVALIADTDIYEERGLRLSPSAQKIRAATTQGLLRLDATGQIVPGIAERWIVTDDGASYIFRLREMDWPDGSRVTGQSVRAELERLRRELRGTSLGLDLSVISDIRAMTGRVVEIRLDAPMPEFLQLLAQPELGLGPNGQGTGPMRAVASESDDDSGDETVRDLFLEAVPPEQRGQPVQSGWASLVKPVAIHAMPARRAIDAFSDGRLDLVLNAQIAHFPMADTGPLSRGTVRVEAVAGLFGLDVVSTAGFLADPDNRSALAMAIDRSALLAPFNIDGWETSERITGEQLSGATLSERERWRDLSLERRRAVASAQIAQWETANEAQVTVRVLLPEGPGSDILFRGLARDFAAVGATAIRAKNGEGADLELRDRVARYNGARWLLNQFNCTVRTAICSADADAIVAQATRTTDQATRMQLFAQAEDLLMDEAGYIPLATPIRWSLVRSSIEGFVDNPLAIHPLFALSGAPI